MNTSFAHADRATQAYHDPSDEPTAEPLDPSFFDFDNGDPLGKEQLKGERRPRDHP